MDKNDLYWQRRILQIERRVEKLEAEISAMRVNPANHADYYTINEFANALGVNRVTVSRRIDKGIINAVKIGKTWRIPKSELDQIFEA